LIFSHGRLANQSRIELGRNEKILSSHHRPEDLPRSKEFGV